eukprot:1044294-Amphidinium_carterae.1
MTKLASPAAISTCHHSAPAHLDTQEWLTELSTDSSLAAPSHKRKQKWSQPHKDNRGCINSSRWTHFCARFSMERAVSSCW